jgi:hypothetical protein
MSVSVYICPAEATDRMLCRFADDMVAIGAADWNSAYWALKRLILPSLKASEEIRQLGMDIVSGIADGIRPGALSRTRTPRRKKRRTRKRRR